MKILATMIMLGVGMLFITPLLWMISSSLKMNREVFAVEFHWIPEVIQWKNYKTVLTSKSIPMMTMFWNSFYLAVVDILGQVLFCSLAAYAFAIIPFKGKDLVFLLLLAATMIPGQATMIPKFMMFKWMGLYNTHWSLILPGWLSSERFGGGGPCGWRFSFSDLVENYDSIDEDSTDQHCDSCFY